MFQANLLPGQGFVQFTVWKAKNGVNETGRPLRGNPEATEMQFFGMLTNASQKEVDQWKQNGHPITHKIVESNAMVKAEATDYLVLPDGREFYVQGVKNPGHLNIAMIYYVEERNDIKKVV